MEGKKEELRYFVIEISHILCEWSVGKVLFSFVQLIAEKALRFSFFFFSHGLWRNESSHVRHFLYEHEGRAEGKVVAMSIAGGWRRRIPIKTCFMLKRFSALSPKLQCLPFQICLISLSETLSRILLSYKKLQSRGKHEYMHSVAKGTIGQSSWYSWTKRKKGRKVNLLSGKSNFFWQTISWVSFLF